LEKRAGMRRLLVVPIWAMVFALVLPTKAQETKPRTFSPPIVNVELSAIEPAPDPSLLTKEIRFGGGAGGPSGEVNRLKWLVTHDFTYPFMYGRESGVHFTACVLDSEEAPTGLITTPGGKNVTVEAKRSSMRPINDSDSARCWDYPFTSSYGMELGQYSIDLQHPLGELHHTWEVDYPYFRVLRGIGEQDTALMGFIPNEAVTVHFYYYFQPDSGNAPPEYRYIATRHIAVDGEGAVVLHHTVARSAPFAESWISVYAELPVAQYPTFRSDLKSGGYRVAFQLPEYQYFQVLAGNMPLYANPGDTARPLAELEVGTPIEIANIKVMYISGRGVPWYYVTDGGQHQGWSSGAYLVPIKPLLAPGGAAQTFKPMDLMDESGKTIGAIHEDSRVTLIRQGKWRDEYVDNTDDDPPQLWYVRTADGHYGWLGLQNLNALPWLPRDSR
jgi:hypothetical protein